MPNLFKIDMNNKTQYSTLLHIGMCLLLGMTICGCQSKYGNASSKRVKDERLAEKLLQQAREQVKVQKLDEAKATIKLMRDTCRYALSGREQGILLLDSIELQRAINDTTKEDHDMRVEFYRRKLLHDQKARLQSIEQ